MPAPHRLSTRATLHSVGVTTLLCSYSTNTMHWACLVERVRLFVALFSGRCPHAPRDISNPQGFTGIPRDSGLAKKNCLGDIPSMKTTLKSGWCSAVFVIALAIIVLALPARSAAQDQDDPPTRVARIGYLEGSVSFQPAGETDWVGAVPNRPMTTGDQLWSDQGSRAELQLGIASIRLSENTGISFLNLDDNTVQLQLSSGTINISVRRLGENDDFEIDTPNQAFTIVQPGRYRVEASADGSYTVVSVRVGEGQATGGGQSFDLHSGQRGTFSGADTLIANVEPIYPFDDFDNWTEGRDHRYDTSRSAQYLSRDVVGYDDLDDQGDWRDDANYGHVWYPQVAVGWAPYHTGHWDWIDPWGYTWVDDSPWGYAPFHYGRWVSVGGRWGWIPGPVAVRAVYAPALVVFVGGGGGWGGNIGWFPLGPREVWVPSYHVSAGYMNRVNVSNTNVNVTVVTNVYNTTVINRTTTVTNITYVNRGVQGAVTAVPQNAFASAQPVARASIRMNAQQIAAAPVSARVAVAPTRQAVLGAKASTASHVTAPPAAVMNRQVVAKRAPPPAPVPFAARQQAMAAHPGVPLARTQVATLRPAAAATARPMVKVAPPGKPATPVMGKPAVQPSAARPGQPPAAQPTSRPNQPAANGRPAAAEPNRPTAAPAPKPSQPPPTRPVTAQPAAQPSRTERPPAAQPTPTPEANRPPAAAPSRPAQPTTPPAPAPSRPETTKPAPPTERPEAAPTKPAPRPATPAPSEHPPQTHTTPPPAAKPAAPPAKQAPKTPEEKKREEEKKPGA